MSARDRVREEAAMFAGAAFDAGVRAVLRTVLDNETLMPNGLGTSLTEKERDSIRRLRRKVHGRKQIAPVRTRKPK